MSDAQFTTKGLLEHFILYERFRYDSDDNNRFALSLGKVQRSHRFLLLTVKRYTELARESTELETKKLNFVMQGIGDEKCGHYPPTPDERLVNKRISDVCIELQMNIEHFYSDAKLLLDHIAHSIHFYFGQAQRCRLGSHNQFLEWFDMYFATKELEKPLGLLELAIDLKKRVIDYRDKMITHDTSPNRAFGICHVYGIEPTIYTQKLGGALADFHSTEPLEVLLRDIERYIFLFLDLLKLNEHKTILVFNEQVRKWSKMKGPISSFIDAERDKH